MRSINQSINQPKKTLNNKVFKSIIGVIFSTGFALSIIIPEQVEAKGGGNFSITGYTCDDSVPKAPPKGKKNSTRYMNCPSRWTKKGTLTGRKPKTATGTSPNPKKTAACPSSKKGKIIDITITYTDGNTRNITRTCEDTGGAIGSGRVDIYTKTYQDALNMTLRKGGIDPSNNKIIKYIKGDYLG